MPTRILDIPERTFKFGVRIVKLALELPKNSAGYAISNQIIRSGTSIGANIEEAQNAQSRKDFIRGMTIALKEARETIFWLRIISGVGLFAEEKITDILQENTEIVRILTTSVKNLKKINC